MDVEDYLQVVNGNVTDVYAPLLTKYPEGYVDTPRLPMALTWPMTDTLDETGTMSRTIMQVDVLVQSLGQDNRTAVKKQCKVLRDLFIVEYANMTGEWLSNDPPMRITPGSIEFGGYRNVILAPDETPFHGFQITMETEVHINVDCD